MKFIIKNRGIGTANRILGLNFSVCVCVLCTGVHTHVHMCVRQAEEEQTEDIDFWPKVRSMDTEDTEGKDHREKNQGLRCYCPTVSGSTLRLHNGSSLSLHWKTEKMGSKRDNLKLPNQQRLESELNLDSLVRVS